MKAAPSCTQAPCRLRARFFLRAAELRSLVLAASVASHAMLPRVAMLATASAFTRERNLPLSDINPERNLHGKNREVGRSRRPGARGLQPVDAVRGIPALHGRREGSAPARRYAPALARRDLGQGQGMGC